MADVRVTVAWVTPAAQELVPLVLSAGATVAMALESSQLARHYDIDINALRVGVNGRLTKRDAILSDGDRIEIYRPLIADPKAVRRARALKKRPQSLSGS